MYFTSSWDDGYKEDLRVAELLNRRGLLGTFYVCPKNQHRKKMLSEEHVRKLGEDHEIGAHTISHPWLTKMPTEIVRRELIESKQWVEQVTGRPCTMFCYPYGDYNKEVRQLVKAAGFLGARTTETLQFSHKDPFAMPVSMQVMTFPWRKRFKPFWKIIDPLGPLRANCGRIFELKIPFSKCTSWLTFTTALFEHAIHTKQPYFHLFGHTSELDRFDLWDQLEDFLDIVKKSGVKSATNSQLILPPPIGRGLGGGG